MRPGIQRLPRIGMLTVDFLDRLMTLYNKAVWRTMDEMLTKPTVRRGAERSKDDP